MNNYLLISIVIILLLLMFFYNKKVEQFDYRIGSESFNQTHEIPDDLENFIKLNY